MKTNRIRQKISDLKDSRDFYKCIVKKDLELLEQLEEAINFIQCCVAESKEKDETQNNKEQRKEAFNIGVSSLVCDCDNKHWKYDESGVDMYCTKCEPKNKNQ